MVLLFCFPPNCVFKQSIYTGFEAIMKKFSEPDKIVEIFKSKLEKLGFFQNAGLNIKWVINKNYNEKEINDFLNVLNEIIIKIKEKSGAASA
jgi:hypothetical protein